MENHDKPFEIVLAFLSCKQIVSDTNQLLPTIIYIVETNAKSTKIWIIDFLGLIGLFIFSPDDGSEASDNTDSN